MRGLAPCLLSASLACAPFGAPAQAQLPADPLAGAQVVDLTHALDERAIFWPTADKFRLDTVAAGRTDKGYYYAANNFCTAEHGGTHLDAPIHFAEGRWTTDQIPLERLIGRAVVVDVTSQVSADRDYQVGIRDFEDWERRHGRIEHDSLVLIRTGYARHWPDAQAYLGTAERGAAAVAKLHFPGLDSAAAGWLVQARKVKAVGIDTASIDHGQSTLFETHRTLSAQNVPALENLAHLERLPPRGATVLALPMKIAGGSGGPVRVIALVPGDR